MGIRRGMEQSTDTEIMTSLFISGAKVIPCKGTGVWPHGICLDRALFAVDQASCLSRGISSSSPKGAQSRQGTVIKFG
jgi:hypothetical protein